MNHTSGPLGIKGPSEQEPPRSDGGDFAIVDEQGFIIGEAINRVDTNEYRPAKENAVLWSVSPQMLDTLEQCERTLTAMCRKAFGLERKRYGNVTVGELLGNVRGVVSKARWKG